MIRVPTSTADEILADFKAKIDAGGIKAWSYDSDGDFTLTMEIWNQKAWLRPKVQASSLLYSIVPPKGESISTAVYAVYHGRMIETMLRHFDKKISGAAEASVMPEGEDDIG